LPFLRNSRYFSQRLSGTTDLCRIRGRNLICYLCLEKCNTDWTD